MTENLLQKLEEKIMLSLSEIEDLRKKLDRAQEDNATLRAEKDNFERKVEARLRDLITLFDTIGIDQTAQTSNLTALKPMLLQENMS